MASLKEILNRLPYDFTNLHTLKQARNYLGVEIFNNQEVINNDILYIVTNANSADLLSQNKGCCICTFMTNRDLFFTESAIVKTNVSAEQLAEQIQTIIFDYIKLEQKKLDIFSCLSCDNPVQKIIDTVADIIQNPFAVGDASIKILAHSNHEPKDTIFKQSWENKMNNGEMVAFFRNKKILGELLESDFPVIFEKSEDMHYRRVLSKVVINGVYAGCCGATEECTPFSWDIQLIIQATVKALEIAMMPNFNKVFLRGRESVISKLLQNEISSENTLLAWLKNIQWTPQQYFSLCVIGELNINTLSASLMGLQQMASRICAHSYLCTFDKYLIIVVNNDNESTVIQNIKKFKIIADMLSAPAASSRPFKELISIRAHMLHVLNTLIFSKIKYPDVSWFDFDQYYMTGVLGSIENVHQLCHPGIIELEKKEHLTHIDYINTLSAFLENGCNITKTAQSLYLHRNTLANRILRIEEITGFDLTNGRDIFNAQLSIMILKFQKP